MTQAKLKIQGMHCASCAVNIEKNLAKSSAIKKVSVNYANTKAYIEFDENKISQNQISKIITGSGDYKVIEEKSEDEHANHFKKAKLKFIISFILSLPLFLSMFISFNFSREFLGIDLGLWLIHNLTFIVVFIIGWQFHRALFFSLKHLRANMDTLVSIGTLAAYFYSLYIMFKGGHVYFETAAIIITLILLGRYLEAKSKGRASLAIKKTSALKC